MNQTEWLKLFFDTTHCTFDLTKRKKKSFQGWDKQGKPIA